MKIYATQKYIINNTKGVHMILSNEMLESPDLMAYLIATLFIIASRHQTLAGGIVIAFSMDKIVR